MKKFIFGLMISTAIFTGCQKDTSTTVKITTNDLSAINGELTGTWVFPAQTLSVVDATGKTVSAGPNVVAPGLKFDGAHSVKIMADAYTSQTGTYKLTTDKGYVYLDVIDSKGVDVQYKVLQVDAGVLKLTSTQPYVYYNGTTPVPAQAVSIAAYQKQSTADVTGNLIRVAVQSDSLYNVGVYVTHNVKAPADTPILMNSRVNVTGSYTYSFVAKPGDHLTIDVFGSLQRTKINAYYDGLPLTGALKAASGEIVTTTGWSIH
ncbi:MAG: hypothetical protein ACXVB0_18860 [Mucilaginibacter sp.]